MTNADAAGPLTGVKVVDLSTTFMGPYCTLLMAQMGADVVKLEAPNGDIVRYIGAGRNAGMGPIFLSVNQGKRSVALDVKRPAGRDALLKVLSTADVLLTNMRLDALKRLRLTFDDLVESHPHLIHCCLAGFGSGGPYSGQAAYDDVIQAISGLAAVQGASGPPEYVRTAVADKTVGLMALSAILAALVGRGRTGLGQRIEVPMFEAMATFTMLEEQGGRVFDPPLGPVGYARTASPRRLPFPTADGYIGVVVYTDRQWQSFFELIDKPELAREARFRTIRERTENIDELYSMLAERLSTRTTEQWLKDFERHSIPAVPVLGVDDLFADAHLSAVNLFVSQEHPTEGRLTLPRLPIDFFDEEQPTSQPAPNLGAHNREVLQEAGLTDAEINRLENDRILTEGPTHD